MSKVITFTFLFLNKKIGGGTGTDADNGIVFQLGNNKINRRLGNGLLQFAGVHLRGR